LKTGRVLFTAAPNAKSMGFFWPTFSPDGKMLAVQDSTGQVKEPATVRLFETESGKELASFDSPGKCPFLGQTFSPDGRRLAAIDSDSNLTVWDVTGRKVERITALTC